MVGRKRIWMKAPDRPVKPDEAEKRQITAACENLIDNFFKPRFLPEIRPTEWNYVVDIYGRWSGGRYSFIQRYRSGRAESLGEEFNAPFARLDRMGTDRFDIHWYRHTGKWWKLHEGLTLAEALHTLETNGILHPV